MPLILVDVANLIFAIVLVLMLFKFVVIHMVAVLFSALVTLMVKVDMVLIEKFVRQYVQYLISLVRVILLHITELILVDSKLEQVMELILERFELKETLMQLTLERFAEQELFTVLILEVLDSLELDIVSILELFGLIQHSLQGVIVVLMHLMF